MIGIEVKDFFAISTTTPVAPSRMGNLLKGVQTNMAEDKTLKCVDCGNDFVFTASEQDFYAEKGFQNEPKRCPDCRRAYKAQKNQQRSFEVTCSECGQQTTVPFEPKDPNRPIYCRDCYAKMKQQG